MIRILVVEDNPILREEVVFFFSRQGHQAQGVADGRAMDKALAESEVDIIVLDIGLPGEDGFSIAERLTQNPNGPGIVALTARGNLDDRLRGLRNGVDAYLVKPADLRELQALVEGLYRRVSPQARPDVSGWRLSLSRRCVVPPQGAEVQLSTSETSILKVLANEKAPVARRDIIAAMGRNYLEFDERRLEVAISRLRRKLMPDNPAACPLRADRGIGYSFAAPLLVED